MRFIETINGDYVNVNEIARMRQYRRSRGSPGEYQTTLTLRDGSTCEIWQDPSKVESVLQPIVPAQPGFELMHSWLAEDGSLEVSSEPVIAWRIDPYGVTPITVDGFPYDDASIIKLPNGHVVIQDECTYEDEAAWRREQLPRQKAMAKANAERREKEKKLEAVKQAKEG